MIETEDYWILENRFVFKPDFNESIDKYHELIKCFHILIFSDYDDVDICIEKNNFFDFQFRNNYLASMFNKKISLDDNLTHLTFGASFNQQVILPLNLTYLTFGEIFNQVVELPESLTHLTFGYDFNQLIELPQNLTNLTLGNSFDFW